MVRGHTQLLAASGGDLLTVPSAGWTAGVERSAKTGRKKRLDKHKLDYKVTLMWAEQVHSRGRCVLSPSEQLVRLPGRCSAGCKRLGNLSLT